MLRWIIGLLLLAALAAAGVAALRTRDFTPPPLTQAGAFAAPPTLTVDAAAAAARLGQAIQFRTVSVQDGETQDLAPFAAQRAWLEATYPAFHAAATRELVNGEGLLFTWQGANPALPPILLLAHTDVVPVEAWSQDQWTVDPWAGAVRDGFVWGRGAVDDKGSFIAIMEAAETLAASGFKPARTIIFAFGHDEEVSGLKGATAMATLLRQRGIKAWFCLDEGMVIVEKYPLTNTPVALIGVAEKGYGTLRVTAEAVAGHSSTPPPDTAVTLLSEAIIRIHRMPIEMKLEGGPAIDMIRALSPQLPLTIRAAAANEWLFSPVINQQLGADPRAAALLRTTVAPTMLEGSVKENVLPGRATALINFRLHPRDTSARILESAQAAVRGIPGVTVDWASPPNEASPVSSTTSDSYALIAAVAGAAGGGAPVAPTLVLGATDSRHYAAVADNVYRFTPAVLSDDEIAGIHGVNEKLSVANVERMIRGYIHLLTAGAGG
ncbi:MAG: M20 family peptidase [Hyphomonadaceae bacterium]|nr:M20 family peptidase [Hyphomonadaceae bacterium]